MDDPSTPPPPPRSYRSWVYFALTLFAAWVLYVNGLNKRGAAPRLEEATASASADFSWAPNDLDGKPVPLSGFKGKPIFLNVWATWCPPCVRELPSIARLAADPKVADVTVLCVATDDSAETVKNFVKDKDWPATMKVLHSTNVPAVFSTEGIPATFIIDRSGRIASAEVGAAEWDQPAVVEFLQKLLKQPGA